MSFIDFINHAGSWIRTINGVIRITEAVCDLDEAINDKSPESNTPAHRFKIAADIAVIATQAISIVGNHSKWSENSRFGISLAAGASDISQNISVLVCKKNLKVNDWIHVGCNIFLRVSSVLNNTIELKPELLGPHIEKVQYTTSILDLVCAGTRCTKDMVLPLIRYLCHRPNPINMVIVIPKDNNLPSELKIDAKWAENIQFILSAKRIDVFDVIPELFQYDEVLKQFICSLTKKPIRHPVVVQGTEDNPQPIYFERKEINERLDDCSLGCPEAWPADIQYSRESLKDAVQIQHQINSRLNILLNQMKGLPIYGLQSPIQNKQLDKLYQLALNIGFNQEDKSDDLLVDDMLSNMHQSIVPLIANITVYTLPYFFEPNSATLTRKILIFPQQTLLKKTTSLTEKELSDATFSLLGSENLQHTHTLKAAFRIFSRVEIYISTDLRHHKVKWS